MLRRKKHRKKNYISIQTKQLFVFMALILIILGTNIYIYFNINKMIESMDRLYERNILLNELQGCLSQVHSHLENFLETRDTDAIEGYLHTSRLQSATPTAGLGFELDAIASSYIGGTAVSGGIGKATNTIIGALVIMSLTNGMNLMGVDISYQYIVKGVIFIIAVAFDVRTRAKGR